MKTLLTVGTVIACAIAAALLVGTNTVVVPVDAKPAAIPANRDTISPLIVHEWGTFTSFSGSNGVAVGFSPNNDDLPRFVYRQVGGKGARLERDGIVSMETPVIYFYSGRKTSATVKVDFPRGWITEWYPFAVTPPQQDPDRIMGQSIQWKVDILPDESLPLRRSHDKNPYFHARATDAVPVQAEVANAEKREDALYHGGAVLQREKFLFYRGVGNFSLPINVRAFAERKIMVKNTSAGQVSGVVLVNVRDGRVGFKALGVLDPNKQISAELPEAAGTSEELAQVMVKSLTAAGLYEKEAQAMVKTWEAAWFCEEGSRVLYLTPQTKTDEILPLSIEPKPAELVRVLVARHDFLTPEQEAAADKQVARIRAAQAEIDSAEKDLRRIGRFADKAKEEAAQRLAASLSAK